MEFLLGKGVGMWLPVWPGPPGPRKGPLMEGDSKRGLIVERPARLALADGVDDDNHPPVGRVVGRDEP